MIMGVWRTRSSGLNTQDGRNMRLFTEKICTKDTADGFRLSDRTR